MRLLNAINSLEGIGTKECAAWREKILRRHALICHYLADGYKRRVNDDDYITANQWLGESSKTLKLGHTGLYADCGEEELNDYCKAKARKCELEIREAVDLFGPRLAPLKLKESVDYAGVTLPLPEDYSKDQAIAAIARSCDPNWWRAQLRRIMNKQMEHFLREEGFVHKSREIYISDFQYERRLSQKARNRKLLEKMEAENELGQVFQLSELADSSPSNPIIRRHELMTRMRGFEDFANNSDEDWQGQFFTLTCPSKYHARYQSGQTNPKYNNSTPKDAQAYLNTVFQRVRAAWGHNCIQPFGMRVVEPHHDGTPHWHLLLFFKADEAKLAADIFEKYALEEDGDEPGAAERRFTTVNIDPAKGSATGYIAKYISKNIDGFNVGADHYGRDAIESAVRIEAWASLWNIRQFQQIGGASVTVWRELRRLESNANKGLLNQLVIAADNADWAEYNELMGGMICRRKDRPLRPMMIERQQENRYGEIIRSIQGLWYGALSVTTRMHEWTLRIKQNIDEEELEPLNDGVGFGVGLSQAPPLGGATLEFCQ